MTKNEAALEVSRLRTIVDLDLATGTLTWKSRQECDFQSSSLRPAKLRAARWNSHLAGRQALACLTNTGYLCGRIDGRFYFAHRVVIAITSGAWPVEMTDHINGIRSDNRPENLRDVPHIENQKNKCRPVINTTGVIGVAFCKATGKWRAVIKVAGRRKHLGVFGSIEGAAQARKLAEAALGFHKNHGRN